MKFSYNFLGWSPLSELCGLRGEVRVTVHKELAQARKSESGRVFRSLNVIKRAHKNSQCLVVSNSTSGF